MSCGYNAPTGSDPNADVNNMMLYQENYDPNMPVCDNQDDFNTAFHKAVKYNNKKFMHKMKPWMYVYTVLWAIFIVWAIMLVVKMPPGPEKIVHMVFAIIFSPVYVLAYYLSSSSFVSGTSSM